MKVPSTKHVLAVTPERCYQLRTARADCLLGVLDPWQPVCRYLPRTLVPCPRKARDSAGRPVEIVRTTRGFENCVYCTYPLLPAVCVFSCSILLVRKGDSFDEYASFTWHATVRNCLLLFWKRQTFDIYLCWTYIPVIHQRTAWFRHKSSAVILIVHYFTSVL